MNKRTKLRWLIQVEYNRTGCARTQARRGSRQSSQAGQARTGCMHALARSLTWPALVAMDNLRGTASAPSPSATCARSLVVIFKFVLPVAAE